MLSIFFHIRFCKAKRGAIPFEYFRCAILCFGNTYVSESLTSAHRLGERTIASNNYIRSFRDFIAKVEKNLFVKKSSTLCSVLSFRDSLGPFHSVSSHTDSPAFNNDASSGKLKLIFV